MVDKGYMTLFSRLKATFLLRGMSRTNYQNIWL
nr:MAG TPA: hypothetical protein [Caudoviricetes sp.]